ncbi:hypothetical protein TrRE_jg8368, partial [Triparma retinervis]
MMRRFQVLLWLTALASAGAAKWGACTVQGGDPKAPVPIDPLLHNCNTSYACEGQADIMFVMDGSGSITSGDANAYNDAMDFLRELAMTFSMGDNLVRVGMVQYSGSNPGLGSCDSVN